MKLSIYLSAATLLALTATTWGGEITGCSGCSECKGARCVTPEPYCPDCSCPCEHRINLAILGGSEHVQNLINELYTGCASERAHAAKKLGCRLHADICCNPEVVTALVKALQCDTCWEVRRAAAWALESQGARMKLPVLALYLSSKLDPHWMVRQASTDALDVMLVCRKGCFKDLFANGDELAKKLKGKYKPSTGECVELVDDCMALCGETAAPVMMGTAGVVMSPGPVMIATPVVVSPGVETVVPPTAEKKN